MLLVIMLHGSDKKLREIKNKASLRELFEMEGLTASFIVGGWLRKIGESGKKLCGLAKR